ncbi:MAG TPA: hypothetical protein VFQ40_08040 [Actinomycetota bacterium]|nr:hypothetical protein [Actinomycetota bacterium]
MRRVAWLAPILPGLLASCGSVGTPSQPGLFFPTDPQQQSAGMDALFEGPLTVRDGCVMIGRPGNLSLAVWPKGFTADRDDSGRVVVRDENGDVIATEGERFDMAGGYVAEFRPEEKVEPQAQQIRRVEEWLGDEIPQRCLASDVYGVWSVGETHPLT